MSYEVIYQSHIMSPKRPGMERTTDMLLDYIAARTKGLTINQSKRYAIANSERKTHSGTMPINLDSPRLERSYWYQGISPWASAPLYDKHIRLAFGKIPSSISLDTFNEIVISALSKSKPKLWKKLTQALENRQRVTGSNPPDALIEMLKLHSLRDDWAKIKRGRDLFVEGWGKFDISATLLSIDEHDTRWLMPAKISACGYKFSSVWAFKAVSDNSLLKAYFGRYKDFWLEHSDVIDELYAHRRLLLENLDRAPHMHPRTFLRIAADFRALQERNSMQYNLPLPLPEKFEDIAKLPIVQTDHGILKPLSSPQECRDIGVAMNNCAASYAHQIAQGSCLLLALINEDGQPIGLGEVRYNSNLKKWEWGQLLGPKVNGQQPQLSKEIKYLFENYEPIASGQFIPRPRHRIQQ